MSVTVCFNCNLACGDATTAAPPITDGPWLGDPVPSMGENDVIPDSGDVDGVVPGGGAPLVGVVA